MPTVLKDVESMLTARPDVVSAAVVDYGTPDPVLILVEPNGFCSGPELRDECAAVLEEAASRVVVLLATEFPQLEAGLPDLESTLREAAYVYRYEPPLTETEERLVALWNRVLDRRRTGATDDFLDLGGDSVNAVRVIAEVSREFGVDIDLMDFFDGPTVRNIATLIDASQNAEAGR
jgi:acyl carrier protein